MVSTQSAVKAPDLNDCLITAFNAARIASSRLLDAYMDQLKGHWEGPPGDPGGPMRDSEREIRRLLYEAFPDHQIYVGEGPERGKAPELFWMVDPLDGAWSFGRGSAFFAVSLSLIGKGPAGAHEPLLGVIMAPVLMEMFWSVAGEGAFQCRQVPGIGLSEGPVSVSDTGRPEEAYVRTALPGPGSGGGGKLAARRLQDSARAVAAEESVSLSLAYVAAGRADGFYLHDCGLWAPAAGAMLVSEAGGKVTGLSGDDYRPEDGGGLLASNGILHWKFLESVSEG
ncbi:MAG: inositol monophosphatase [Deltaproteobacteria bacterium]|jgi:myo-inositol-1(or 4)-monophosphatase|nr:inositol monophosphatase [Deltaproteobacteria bacterium]